MEYFLVHLFNPWRKVVHPTTVRVANYHHTEKYDDSHPGFKNLEKHLFNKTKIGTIFFGRWEADYVLMFALKGYTQSMRSYLLGKPDVSCGFLWFFLSLPNIVSDCWIRAVSLFTLRNPVLYKIISSGIQINMTLLNMYIGIDKK